MAIWNLLQFTLLVSAVGVVLAQTGNNGFFQRVIQQSADTVNANRERARADARTTQTQRFSTSTGTTTGAVTDNFQTKFSRSNELSRTRSILGEISERSARMISESLSISPRNAFNELPSVDIGGSILDIECPYTVPLDCTRFYGYRTFDGTCNNEQQPYLGSAVRPFKRLLPPHYGDGISTLRGSPPQSPLPSARDVSLNVHETKRELNFKITQAVMQWAQIIDHDLTLTPIATDVLGNAISCCPVRTHEQCEPIAVNNDPVYGDCETCMNFVRSVIAPRSDCKIGPREQFNQITAYLDASMVYGSNVTVADNLRSGQNGMLRTTTQPDRSRKDLLPVDINDDSCEAEKVPCFAAGDIRVNEQPGLTSFHTLLMREHNRIATILASRNRNWDDERIYQETRAIVGAIVQHITYNEFLPLVLGKDMSRYNLQSFYNYDPSVDATIANEFATAAYRFGHTLIPLDLIRVSSRDQGTSPLELHTSFFDPSTLYGNTVVSGPDPLVIGLTRQVSEAADENLVDAVRNKLFGENLDLAALNIQRGRDHGLPGYNSYRQLCGLRRANRISEFSEIPGDIRAKLQRVYRTADDVDLFTGGISEKPVLGGLVGPTFSCIIGKQFEELRLGDRFFYENPNSFTSGQLNEIRQSTLARIMCDNGDDIHEVQPLPFLLPNTPINRDILLPDFFKRSFDSNYIAPCRNIPAMNLDLWSGLQRNDNVNGGLPSRIVSSRPVVQRPRSNNRPQFTTTRSPFFRNGFFDSIRTRY